MAHLYLVILIVVVLLVCALLPFLIPLPLMKDTCSPRQLAEADSKFVTVNNLEVHYKSEGKGPPTLILLHGFGASCFTWHKVMIPLAKRCRVIAYDRTGFGLTSRPLSGSWSGENPYSPLAQAQQTVDLMDLWGVERAILVGSSAGGATAALVSLKFPERVEALILVDAAIYSGGPPGWITFLMRIPQLNRVGPLLVRKGVLGFFKKMRFASWHNPSKLTDEILKGYQKPFRVKDWDRALWEFARAYNSTQVKELLGSINLPVLVITGEWDKVVPKKDSVRLAEQLPYAELKVIPRAGHLPHEETPEEFLEAVNGFLDRVAVL